MLGWSKACLEKDYSLPVREKNEVDHLNEFACQVAHYFNCIHFSSEFQTSRASESELYRTTWPLQTTVACCEARNRVTACSPSSIDYKMKSCRLYVVFC